MPKKTTTASRPDKRVKRRVMVRPAAAAEPQGDVSGERPAAQVTPSRAAWAPVSRTLSRSSGVIRDEDYRYIYSDLRRIGLLAGSLFAVLVVLTFVLR